MISGLGPLCSVNATKLSLDQDRLHYLDGIYLSLSRKTADCRGRDLRQHERRDVSSQARTLQQR